LKGWAPPASRSLPTIRAHARLPAPH
jgi:hypothetical protein